MTSRFAKESEERDTTRRFHKDQRREHVNRRPDRGLRALNKYNNHQETDHRPIPPQHREVTPLNVSIAKILVAVQDKNLL